ncbi:MAG: hypothetical protein K9M07_04460 [Simkaniaceae bacterium]|nr:hypothetical protein [Simkaniaceae bacterium]
MATISNFFYSASHYSYMQVHHTMRNLYTLFQGWVFGSSDSLARLEEREYQGLKREVERVYTDLTRDAKYSETQHRLDGKKIDFDDAALLSEYRDLCNQGTWTWAVTHNTIESQVIHEFFDVFTCVRQEVVIESYPTLLGGRSFRIISSRSESERIDTIEKLNALAGAHFTRLPELKEIRQQLPLDVEFNVIKEGKVERGEGRAHALQMEIETQFAQLKELIQKEASMDSDLRYHLFVVAGTHSEKKIRIDDRGCIAKEEAESSEGSAGTCDTTLDAWLIDAILEPSYEVYIRVEAEKPVDSDHDNKYRIGKRIQRCIGRSNAGVITMGGNDIYVQKPQKKTLPGQLYALFSRVFSV